MASEANINFIVEALGKGISESAIASHLGVTQSAVSQLIEAKNLKARLNSQEIFQRIDTNLNDIELKITEKLNQMLDLPALMLNPLQLGRLLKDVNSSKRRGIGEGLAQAGQAQIVALQLPKFIQQQYIVSANNELLEIDGQTLTTLPESNIKQLCDQHLKPALENPNVPATREQQSIAAANQAKLEFLEKVL